MQKSDSREPDTVAPVAIVLGSGLGTLLQSDKVKIISEIAYADIPHFPVMKVVGHSGRLALCEIAGQRVVCCAGRSHSYSGYYMYQVTLIPRVLAAIGVKVLLVSNASGGIRHDMVTGCMMCVTDHMVLSAIDPLEDTYADPGLSGIFDSVALNGVDKKDDCVQEVEEVPWTVSYASLEPKQVQLAGLAAGKNKTDMYDPELIDIMFKFCDSLPVPCFKGTYGWTSGPSYETPSEVQWYREMGVSAVGMSTINEVLTAYQLGMAVFGMSVISNLGAGMQDVVLLHEDVTAVANDVGKYFIEAFVHLVGNLPERVLKEGNGRPSMLTPASCARLTEGLHAFSSPFRQFPPRFDIVKDIRRDLMDIQQKLATKMAGLLSVPGGTSSRASRRGSLGDAADVSGLEDSSRTGSGVLASAGMLSRQRSGHLAKHRAGGVPWSGLVLICPGEVGVVHDDNVYLLGAEGVADDLFAQAVAAPPLDLSPGARGAYMVMRSEVLILSLPLYGNLAPHEAWIVVSALEEASQILGIRMNVVEVCACVRAEKDQGQGDAKIECGKAFPIGGVVQMTAPPRSSRWSFPSEDGYPPCGTSTLVGGEGDVIVLQLSTPSPPTRAELKAAHRMGLSGATTSSLSFYHTCQQVGVPVGIFGVVVPQTSHLTACRVALDPALLTVTVKSTPTSEDLVEDDGMKDFVEGWRNYDDYDYEVKPGKARFRLNTGDEIDVCAIAVRTVLDVSAGSDLPSTNCLLVFDQEEIVRSSEQCRAGGLTSEELKVHLVKCGVIGTPGDVEVKALSGIHGVGCNDKDKEILAQLHLGSLVACLVSFKATGVSVYVLMVQPLSTIESAAPYRLRTRLARSLAVMGFDRVTMVASGSFVGTAEKEPSLFVVKDHINSSGRSPLMGEHVKAFGDRFFDLGAVYGHRDAAKGIADKAGIQYEEGVVCFPGVPLGSALFHKGLHHVTCDIASAIDGVCVPNAIVMHQTLSSKGKGGSVSVILDVTTSGTKCPSLEAIAVGLAAFAADA